MLYQAIATQTDPIYSTVNTFIIHVQYNKCMSICDYDHISLDYVSFFILGIESFKADN